MKKYLIGFISACFAVFSALATPDGTYLTWLGAFAGNNGYGDYSSLFGAYAGANAQGYYMTGMFGALSGNGSWNLDNCFLGGYRTMQDACDMSGCVAFGNSAGRSAQYCSDSYYFGRDAGREANANYKCFFVGESEGYSSGAQCRISFFSNDGQYCYYDENGICLDSYITATRVSFFGWTLYDLIQNNSYAYTPYYLSELRDDVGYVTFNDLSDYPTWEDMDDYFSGDQLYSSMYDWTQYVSMECSGKMQFINSWNYNNNYGITIGADHYNSVLSASFGSANWNQGYSIVQRFTRYCGAFFENGSMLAFKSGSKVWIENPDKVKIGGTDYNTGASTLANYIKSVATPEAINAAAKFTAGTTVNLRNDDELYAAVQLILERMGATVNTTPAADDDSGDDE